MWTLHWICTCTFCLSAYISADALQQYLHKSRSIITLSDIHFLLPFGPASLVALQVIYLINDRLTPYWGKETKIAMIHVWYTVRMIYCICREIFPYFILSNHPRVNFRWGESFFLMLEQNQTVSRRLYDDRNQCKGEKYMRW